MKSIIFTFIFISFSFIVKAQSEFSKGFKEGYKAGYCYQKTGCTAPMTPIAPTPTYPEKSSSYQDGYNRGFTDGKSANNGGLNGTINNSNNIHVADDPGLDYYLNEREKELQQQKIEQEKKQKEQQLLQKEYEKTKLASLKEIYKTFNEIPSKVKDGWHQVIITNDIDEYMERKVKVKDNKITEYFKEDWIEFGVKYSSEIDSCIALVKLIRPNGIENDDYSKVYFMDYISDTVNLAEEPVGSGSIGFWLDFKSTAGPIKVYIDNLYAGQIEMYFDDGFPQNCDTKGVLNVKFKAGKHKFSATNNWRTWESEIDFVKDDCSLFRLYKK